MRIKIVIVLAFVFILISIFLVAIRSSVPDSKNGYRLFTSKKPFHVMVDGGFPNSKKALFISDYSNAVFETSQSVGGGIDVKVSVRPYASVSMNAGANGDPSLLILALTDKESKRQIFIDINLDGIWDAKILQKNNERFANINNVWVNVDKLLGIEKHDAKAEAGTRKYIFNYTDGVWK